jgi:hypothetical protein
MNLLEISRGAIVINPQALTIEEFRSIWEMDRTKDKDRAVQELSFVYFMADWQSPYKTLNEYDRRERVIKDVFRGARWMPSKEVEAAFHKYELMQAESSPSYLLLRDAREAVNKVRDFFRTVDIEGDIKGSKMTTLLRTLSSIADIIKGLAILEAKVEADMLLSHRVKGGRQIGNRESPDKIVTKHTKK